GAGTGVSCDHARVRLPAGGGAPSVPAVALPRHREVVLQAAHVVPFVAWKLLEAPGSEAAEVELGADRLTARGVQIGPGWRLDIDYTSQLEFDEDGLVVLYPGLAERL